MDMNKVILSGRICSDIELKNSEKYVVIGSLDCEYEFWGYDLNEFRYRTRVYYTSFPIRIAIKTK